MNISGVVDERCGIVTDAVDTVVTSSGAPNAVFTGRSAVRFIFTLNGARLSRGYYVEGTHASIFRRLREKEREKIARKKAERKKAERKKADGKKADGKKADGRKDKKR